jgi:hypothetical protein
VSTHEVRVVCSVLSQTVSTPIYISRFPTRTEEDEENEDERNRERERERRTTQNTVRRGTYLNKVGLNVAFDELGMLEHIDEEGDVVMKPSNAITLKSVHETTSRILSTLRTVNYKLGDHRVVVHGHYTAFFNPRVHTHVRSCRRRTMHNQLSSRGQEISNGGRER